MRANFYVDGFNLYHALHDLGSPHLRWLSLADVARRLHLSKSEKVEAILYFSAYATHLANNGRGTLARHHAYVDALQATGVRCIMGRFKLKPTRCRHCDHVWQRPEEKETDVAIGVALLTDAFTDSFEVAYILSGDSDLAPAIRAVRKHFPDKELVTVSMPGRHPSKELLALTNRHVRLRPGLIEQCLLPQRIDRRGDTPILRPTRFNPPA